VTKLATSQILSNQFGGKRVILNILQSFVTLLCGSSLKMSHIDMSRNQFTASGQLHLTQVLCVIVMRDL